MIYLDHAASSPLTLEAEKAWIRANRDFFANSSSIHESGSQAALLIKEAQQIFSSHLHCQPSEIYFTSGGTESNQLAILSMLEGTSKKGKHIITSKMEHPSLLSVFSKLEDNGYLITYVSPDRDGSLSLKKIASQVTKDTILISFQHVNSEIGVVQPIREIGTWCKKNNILFHSDAVQSFGKLNTSNLAESTDSLSISAHKIGGPNGIGVLYLADRTKWKSIFPSVSHQRGLKAGTLDTASIISCATASQAAIKKLDVHALKVQELRALFINGLNIEDRHLKVYGSSQKDKQSPYILGIGITGIQGQWMQLALDRYQISISTGSACLSHALEGAEVLQALGASQQEKNRFFRISFGYSSTKTEINKVLFYINKFVKENAM